jgi:hypothetical protein
VLACWHEHYRVQDAEADGPSSSICRVDTFNGFVAEQFTHDERRGTPAQARSTFDANSLHMVQRLLDHWDAPEIELVQGDIATMASDWLPEQIAVCLIDVDLEIPVYEA